MIDIAIIGSGPAGLSAAVNGRARNKAVELFGRKMEDSAIYKAEKVNNYLGMPGFTGKEMMAAFTKHATEAGAVIHIGRVLQILPMGEHFSINFNNDIVEAKTVILAMGSPHSSTITGEQEFLGKGVSYCATCDGMLYRDKNVVVVGESEEGIEDANFLSEICSQVYYIPKKGTTQQLNDNVKVVDGKAEAVFGKEVVEGIKTDKGQIESQGVFFIKEAVPPANLVFGLEMDGNKIKTDKEMKTNIPGLFAAGDCTGRPWQVAKAVGEGLVAALSAASYLKDLGQSKG